MLRLGAGSQGQSVGATVDAHLARARSRLALEDADGCLRDVLESAEAERSRPAETSALPPAARRAAHAQRAELYEALGRFDDADRCLRAAEDCLKVGENENRALSPRARNVPRSDGRATTPAPSSFPLKTAPGGGGPAADRGGWRAHHVRARCRARW